MPSVIDARINTADAINLLLAMSAMNALGRQQPDQHRDAEDARQRNGVRKVQKGPSLRRHWAIRAGVVHQRDGASVRHPLALIDYEPPGIAKATN